MAKFTVNVLAHWGNSIGTTVTGALRCLLVPSTPPLGSIDALFHMCFFVFGCLALQRLPFGAVVYHVLGLGLAHFEGTVCHSGTVLVCNPPATITIIIKLLFTLRTARTKGNVDH